MCAIKKKNIVDEKTTKISSIATDKIYGHRFTLNQTFFEYLLEFLLVFLHSYDNNNGNGFEIVNSDNKIPIYRYLKSIGLKRFIFFKKSKKETQFKIDDELINRQYKALEKKVIIQSTLNERDKKRLIPAIADLLIGYEAILFNRSWFAQSLIPISPELVFGETMFNLRKRKNLGIDDEDYEIEKDSAYAQGSAHNFFARGGELYYLHLFHGLNNNKEKQIELSKKIFDLISIDPFFNDLAKILKVIFNDISKPVDIEDSDDELSNRDITGRVQTLRYNLNNYISESKTYLKYSQLAVDEIINFIDSDYYKISKIELLAKGIVLQLLKSMDNRVANFKIDTEDEAQQRNFWVMDFVSEKLGKTFKPAVEFFQEHELYHQKALNQLFQNKDVYESFFSETLANDNSDKNKFSDSNCRNKIREASNRSFKLFRKLAKSIGLVVPKKGPGMRFTLNDDLIRFLLLAIVKPEQIITMDDFLDKLYDHYDIVISHRHFEKMIESNPRKQELLNYVTVFEENEKCFVDKLYKNGFLYKLSDATSLVLNPYKKVGKAL